MFPIVYECDWGSVLCWKATGLRNTSTASDSVVPWDDPAELIGRCGAECATHASDNVI